MPQIAQQDYLIFHIESSDLTAEQKEILRGFIDKGNILDVLIENAGSIGRVVAYDDYVVYYSDPLSDGAVSYLDAQEE